MYIKKLLIVVFLSTTISPVFSDAVIFQTDFNELPDNWFATDNWEFGPDGAVTGFSYWQGYWFADMLTSNGDTEFTYFVPDGTDSILVTIPYYLGVEVFDGSAYFSILMQASGSGWTEIWSESVIWYEWLFETATINVSPDWISGGEWISIRFKGWGGSEEYSNVHWEIQGLTITAIGDNLALDNSTWAEIKSISGWE